MSNYINVLRRLERERRAPETVPVPVPTEPVTRSLESAPTPTIVEPTPAPIALSPSQAPVFAPTPVITAPIPVAAPPIPVAAPPTPRTVIPLPSVTPPPPAPTMTAPPAPAPVVARAPEPRPHDTRRERAFATESHPGIATLLENIRLISNGRESRMVVFCGASTAEAVSVLATSLATHAERSGMRTFVAMLNRTSAGPAVVPFHGASDTALAVDLDSGSSLQTLGTWVEQLAPGSDLVIFTGPPLATSIDAALLACACDGLVIVAESEVTERAALQIAAERARIAGCKTLGVVMHGTKDRTPGWLRRLMGERSESHASRED